MLGRSSARLRNPDNEAPAWVQRWLAAHSGSKAEGLEPVVEIEDDTAHFLMPIAMEAMCLTCHGPEDTIAPEIAAVLAERYPADQATGYAVGDLRGVMWAEASVQR
jgi:hypothetical protein